MNGKVLGVPLQKWKQGIGWGAVLSLFLMLVAVYSNYGQPNSAIVSRQYVLLGAGIFVFLLLTRQVLGFFGKEDMLVDLQPFGLSLRYLLAQKLQQVGLADRDQSA